MGAEIEERLDRLLAINVGCASMREGCATGFRPRRMQTAKGELQVEIPHVWEAAEPFVSRLFPRDQAGRSEPLRVMVIGAFVRGLSLSPRGKARRPPARESAFAPSPLTDDVCKRGRGRPVFDF
jgi:hypothetical protein